MRVVTIAGARFELDEGDITEQEVDAVVNAAHWDLLGGNGVDGAIHYRGGPEILAECQQIGGCPIGGAVLTTGGKLPARYVIHAVGPIYEPDDDLTVELLDSAYRESLRLAAAHGLRSVAFPSLSTGAFNYPLPEAAPVALNAILDFLATEPHNLSVVRLVLYPREQPDAYAIYADALRGLRPDAHDA
jgi:O-acetyl-ADP-ribose deacetylase